MAYEILPRELLRVGEDRWEGLRTILCLKGEAQVYARSSFGQTYPEALGDDSPIVSKTRAIYGHGGLPGVAAVMMYYETPRDAGPEGRARIIIKRRPEPAEEAVVVDLDGEVVAGVLPDGMHEYRLLQGSNIRPKLASVDIIVQTAVTPSEFNLAATLGLLGYVNDSTLMNFGNAAAETCLLTGVELDYLWGLDIINLNYYFGWDPRGWNDAIQVEKGVWLPVKLPAWDKNSAGEWEYNSTGKYVLTFLPGREATYQADGSWLAEPIDPESRRIFEATSFSDLDSRVEW